MTQAQSAPENKMTDDEIIDSIGAYEYGWHDSDAAGASARRGLNEDVAVSYTHLTLPTICSV